MSKESISSYRAGGSATSSEEPLKVLLVYAIGLAMTLIVAWLRDPHSLF